MKKKGLKRLGKHLQSSKTAEPYALDFHKRLNSAGLDFNGQVSTAYAQSGIGLSLGLSFDFGGHVAPFVHLVPELKASGSRTAHGLFVLSRMPRKIWHKPTQPKKAKKVGSNDPLPKLTYHTPDWTTHHPICLSFLRGATWEFEGEASASAWVGVGAAFDGDETGATAGLRLKGGFSGSYTRLREPRPQQYSGPMSQTLAKDVNAYFKDGIKRKAAGWLIINGKGPKAAMKAGAPSEQPRRWPIWRRRVGFVHDAIAEDAANAWDTHDTALINRGFGGAFKALGKVIANLASNLAGNNLQSQDLLDRLYAAEQAFNEVFDDETALFKDSYRRFVLTDDYGRIRRTDRSKWSDAAKFCELRRNEARALIETLAAAREFRESGVLKRTEKYPEDPDCMLDMTVREGHGSLEAGAQLVFPKILRQTADPSKSKTQFGEDPETNDRSRFPSGSVKLSGDIYEKRIGVRHQTFLKGASKTPRQLVMTQDTAITYRSRRVTPELRIAKESKGEPSEAHLITMSYRAATAFFYIDDDPLTKTALPNVSGVSFGLSVLKSRIRGYANALKAEPEGFIHELEGLSELEQAMMEQLRLTKAELRSFFRSVPEWLTGSFDAGEAFVVEAAFALKAAEPLPMSGDRPKDLFDLTPLKTRADYARRDQAQDTELQSIRLRFRLRTDEDRTRNFFNLGWNPMVRVSEVKEDGKTIERESVVPFMDQGNYNEDLKSFEQFKEFGGDVDKGFMPAMMSLGIERVERAGAEGIVTVHEYLAKPFHDPVHYGPEQAERMQDRYNRSTSDLLVPPVTLFSQ